MALTTTIRAAFKADLEGSNDLATPKINIPFHADIKWLTGTTANRADLLFADTRTIAASGSENLDLAGALLDPLGATITMATVKAILVRAAAANTNNVHIGNGTSPVAGIFGATADFIVVAPGGAFLWADPDGVTVTATTADQIGVANSGAGTSVTYDIMIIGASA